MLVIGEVTQVTVFQWYDRDAKLGAHLRTCDTAHLMGEKRRYCLISADKAVIGAGAKFVEMHQDQLYYNLVIKCWDSGRCWMLLAGSTVV